MKVITAKMIFDGPTDPRPSKHREGSYRTVTLEMPDNAPKAEYDADREEWRYYHYTDVGTEEEAYWLSLGRGDSVQLAYIPKGDSGYYKPIVPDDWEPEQTPQQAIEAYEAGSSRDPDSSYGKSYDKESYTAPKRAATDLDWLNPDHVQAVKLVSTAIGDLLYDLIEELKNMGLEEKTAQKVAVTGFIEAKGYVKKYGVSVVDAVSGALSEIEGEEAIIRGIDPDGLPGSFLVACAAACPNIDDRDEAAAILKKFGFGREDLDPEDEDGWVYLYSVARAYAYATEEEGLPDQDAVDKVAEAFGLDVNVEPF